MIGILDWELSTLGNQMCDVAYSCLVLMSIATLMELLFYFIMFAIEHLKLCVLSEWDKILISRK